MEYSRRRIFTLTNFAREMTMKTIGNRTVQINTNGYARISIVLFELITKKLFERYSTVYRTINIRTNVKTRMMGRTDDEIAEFSIANRNAWVEKIPKKTREAIFPIRVVPMNHVGRSVKKVMMSPERFRCFPRSSI
jgi:hypothetical protein